APGDPRAPARARRPGGSDGRRRPRRRARGPPGARSRCGRPPRVRPPSRRHDRAGRDGGRRASRRYAGSASAGGTPRRREDGAEVRRPAHVSPANGSSPASATSSFLVAHGGKGNVTTSGTGIAGWLTTIVPGFNRRAGERVDG